MTQNGVEEILEVEHSCDSTNVRQRKKIWPSSNHLAHDGNFTSTFKFPLLLNPPIKPLGLHRDHLNPQLVIRPFSDILEIQTPPICTIPTCVSDHIMKPIWRGRHGGEGPALELGIKRDDRPNVIGKTAKKGHLPQTRCRIVRHVLCCQTGRSRFCNCLVGGLGTNIRGGVDHERVDEFRDGEDRVPIVLVFFGGLVNSLGAKHVFETNDVAVVDRLDRHGRGRRQFRQRWCCGGAG